MMKFYIGQKVSFETVGKRRGTIVEYRNGIYKIDCGDCIFGMKEDDLVGE